MPEGPKDSNQRAYQRLVFQEDGQRGKVDKHHKTATEQSANNSKESRWDKPGGKLGSHASQASSYYRVVKDPRPHHDPYHDSHTQNWSKYHHSDQHAQRHYGDAYSN